MKCKRRQFLRALGMLAGASVLPWGAFAQPTIKIGLVTGLETIFGENTRNGAQIAVDEINAAGGLLQRRVELVIGDIKTELDGVLARSVFQDIASRTDAVVGFFRSEAVLAILPDIPRLKKPLLITGATSLATDRVVGEYENYKYAFRSVIINTYSLVVDTLRFAGDFVYTAVQNGALRNRRVVMVNEDLTSGNLFMALIGPRLGELGFEVVNQFRIAVGTRDLSPIITQIAATGAQTVFTFFADPGLGTGFPTAWAANNMQNRAVLYGINAPLQADTVVQGLRGAATGHFLADFSADAPVTEKTKLFFRAYQERFKTRPVYTAGTTYDSIHWLAEAIRRANSTNADDLVRALEGTATTGAGGPLSFYSRADYDRAQAQPIVVETKAAPALSFSNTIPAGITNLSLVNPHDTRYGFKKGDKTAYDGIRPIWTVVRELKPDGSFDRDVAYPAEFRDKDICQALKPLADAGNLWAVVLNSVYCS